MKKIIVPSLAEPVGTLWKNLQEKYTQEGTFSVAAPLSSTPLPIYEWLVKHANEFSHWDKVKFVLMDEMLEGDESSLAYVSVNDPASYEGFAQKHLFTPLRQKTATSLEVIKPEVANIESFDTEIDLLILALGIGGNFANVMPGTPGETSWHIAPLTPEYRQSHTEAGSKSYEGANFREYGMSLGPQQVLKAKNVVVIISGEKKRELAKQLLSYNSFDPAFPLSIIHHPDCRDRVTVYLTEDVS